MIKSVRLFTKHGKVREFTHVTKISANDELILIDGETIDPDGTPRMVVGYSVDKDVVLGIIILP